MLAADSEKPLDPVELDVKAKRWIKQFYETNNNVFFEHLVRNFNANLLAFLKGQISDNDNKKFEYVASETWWKCYKNLKIKGFDITAKNSFKTYLFTLAKHTNIDLWRSKQEKRSRDNNISWDLYNEPNTNSEEEDKTLTGVLALTPNDENDENKDHAINKVQENKQKKEWTSEEIIAMIKICEGKLSLEQQRVYVLRMDNLFSNEKTAQLTDSLEETVRTRLATAKNKIRKCLKPHFPDYFNVSDKQSFD